MSSFQKRSRRLRKGCSLNLFSRLRPSVIHTLYHFGAKFQYTKVYLAGLCCPLAEELLSAVHIIMLPPSTSIV